MANNIIEFIAAIDDTVCRLVALRDKHVFSWSNDIWPKVRGQLNARQKTSCKRVMRQGVMLGELAINNAGDDVKSKWLAHADDPILNMSLFADDKLVGHFISRLVGKLKERPDVQGVPAVEWDSDFALARHRERNVYESTIMVAIDDSLGEMQSGELLSVDDAADVEKILKRNTNATLVKAALHSVDNGHKIFLEGLIIGAGWSLQENFNAGARRLQDPLRPKSDRRALRGDAAALAGHLPAGVVTKTPKRRGEFRAPKG